MSIETAESTSSSTQPSEPNAATQEAQKPSIQEQPKPQAPPGAAFAALDRRNKATQRAEQQLEQRRQELDAKAKAIADLEQLDPVAFIEELAKRRGTSSDDILKDYVQRKTGTPPAEKVLAESKDPAVQALVARQEALAKETAATKAQIQAEKQALIDERNSTARAQAVADCHASAKAVFTDDSDYPFFFEDADQLGEAVFAKCSALITKYLDECKQYGVEPEDATPEKIAILVKDMPAKLLQQRLSTKAGQKLVSLRTQAAAPPPVVPGFKPRLSVSGAGNKDKAQPQISTRLDHNARIDAAVARLPKDKLLPGERPPPE